MVVISEIVDHHMGDPEIQQPILAHAPNFSFHSCLYFSHHSSSHVWRVSPQTMILKRACSSAVQATPSNSPLVTGAWLRSLPAEASTGNKSRAITDDVRISGKRCTVFGKLGKVIFALASF